MNAFTMRDAIVDAFSSKQASKFDIDACDAQRWHFGHLPTPPGFGSRLALDTHCGREAPSLQHSVRGFGNTHSGGLVNFDRGEKWIIDETQRFHWSFDGSTKIDFFEMKIFHAKK